MSQAGCLPRAPAPAVLRLWRIFTYATKRTWLSKCHSYAGNSKEQEALLFTQLYFTTNVVAKKTYIIKHKLNKLNK